MLYYGNEFTFRTIPNTSYLIKIYGYKKNGNYPLTDDGDPNYYQDIQYDYWLRYLAYGAVCNYARDYRFEGATLSSLISNFAHERKLMLAHAHNQIKMSRCMPRF
jgi:hypothetical protein